MARQSVVIGGLEVAVEPLDFEFGGWCRTCLVPSGVHVTAMVTIGPSAHLREFDRCADCGGDQVDAPERPDVDHL